jgi:hypothetical protein
MPPLVACARGDVFEFAAGTASFIMMEIVWRVKRKKQEEITGRRFKK